MTLTQRRFTLLALVAPCLPLGCGGARAPAAEVTAAKPPAKRVPEPPPTAPSTESGPYEQPESCPPPLTWEDGLPIEISELCPDQPAYFFHEGACCRYPNGCLAPQGATSYEKLEQCEAARTAFKERSMQPAVCKPGELVWQPSFCVFASCRHGQFVTPAQESADCQRPIGLGLSFELNEKTLSMNHIAQLENFAVRADVLGVKHLRLEGSQSYDETPGATSPSPLSLQRAKAVRDALANVTSIPVEVADAGTASRTRGTASLFRRVTVTMAPLEEDHAAAQTKPFTLPWTPCESSVTFRTQIALTKHDGDVVVEVCRDTACSRAAMRAPLLAAWPGSGGERMTGALDAWLSWKETQQQLIRNGFNALAHGGVPGELDGESPASFNLGVSFRDPAISETSTYSLRLMRRRSETALDWSGKLPFERTLRHPTRDPAPCLRAELEIPRTQHSLH